LAAVWMKSGVQATTSTEPYRGLGNHEKPVRREKPDGLAVYHGKGSAPAYGQYYWQWAMGNGQWAMGNGQWAMGNYERKWEMGNRK
jgi:hypothetical protein